MILSPNGTPIGKPQGPQLIGWIILRHEGTLLMPMTNDKGHLAIFNDAKVALDTAKQMADAELRPQAEQKVVTPQMKSHQYVVVQCAAIGTVQAQIKNPAQLLAPSQAEVN